MCRKYSIERQTSRFAINYYVRPDFEESYADGSLELTRLERQVEDEYISTLQHNCYRERSYRKSLKTQPVIRTSLRSYFVDVTRTLL